MNELFLLLLCVLGALVDAALFALLLRRPDLGPALVHGIVRHEIVADPLIISSEREDADLRVEKRSDATTEVHIFRGDDGGWRVRSYGSEQVELNGRPLSRILRLFDGSELQIGATIYRFVDKRSPLHPPKVREYRIDGKPYVGGSSLVYPAQSRQVPSRRALLKVHDPSREEEDLNSLKGRIEREYQFLLRAFNASAALSPRPFAENFGVMLDDGGYSVIAMEQIAGPNLAHAMEDTLVRLANVLAFGRAMAGALEILEREGIVHADLKPGNIILRDGKWDTPCLVDFGIAVESGERHSFGTPHYMSPEHKDQAELVPASDVYVLGTLLRNALLKVEAHERSTAPEALHSLLESMLAPRATDRPSAIVVKRSLDAML